MSKVCKQYYFAKRREAKQTFDTFAEECIASFIKTVGYRPSILTANQVDLNEMHVRMDIDVMAEHIQPHHIRLYEIVTARRPKVLKVPRQPA